MRRPSEERRSHPRSFLSGHASIRVLGEPLTQDGQVIDLSRSGVLLETSPLAIGTRVRTAFLGVEASGTVVREITGLGAGSPTGVAVRFDEVQDSIRNVVCNRVGEAAAGDAILTAVESGETKILLDMGNVPVVDSSFIGELISAYTVANNRGSAIKLLNLSPRVLAMLKITGLTGVFDIFDDEAAAVASFARRLPDLLLLGRKGRNGRGSEPPKRRVYTDAQNPFRN